MISMGPRWLGKYGFKTGVMMRFNEGEVTMAKPRRGSQLYKIAVLVLLAAVQVCAFGSGTNLVQGFGKEKKPLVVGIADKCMGLVGGKPTVGVRASYCRSVYASGNVPFVIPATTNRDEIARAFDNLDALILCGGEDVAPARYGAEALPKCGKPNLLRDTWEWALLDEAVKRRTPVVGTCRGLQLINVYFGGTLYQDLPSECPGVLMHCADVRHPIDVEPGSHLAEIFGTTNAVVNTWHHQAVKDLAPGFRITARAPDGVVEAIESETLPIAAVQFHPEVLFAAKGERAYLDFFTYILSWAGAK